jgi:hypothetical protein
VSQPEVRVAHVTRGRIRLRVVGAPPDGAFSKELERALKGSPAVRAISIRPLTGSLIVEHTGTSDEMLRWAKERAILHADVDAAAIASAAEDPLTHLAHAIEDASEHLRRIAGGELDLRTLAFYGLVGAGALQITRGNLLPAAETLLIHALGLLPRPVPSR